MPLWVVSACVIQALGQRMRDTIITLGGIFSWMLHYTLHLSGVTGWTSIHLVPFVQNVSLLERFHLVKSLAWCINHLCMCVLKLFKAFSIRNASLLISTNSLTQNVFLNSQKDSFLSCALTWKMWFQVNFSFRNVSYYESQLFALCFPIFSHRL